jgi:hypothetical protein
MNTKQSVINHQLYCVSIDFDTFHNVDKDKSVTYRKEERIKEKKMIALDEEQLLHLFRHYKTSLSKALEFSKEGKLKILYRSRFIFDGLSHLDFIFHFLIIIFFSYHQIS